MVNPIGMIMAAALMLRFTFGMEDEAQAIEEAAKQVVEDGFATGDIWEEGKVLVSTGGMGEQICRQLTAF